MRGNINAELKEVLYNFGEIGENLDPGMRLRQILNAPSLEIGWLAVSKQGVGVRAESYEPDGIAKTVTTTNLASMPTRYSGHRPHPERMISNRPMKLWCIEIYRTQLKLFYLADLGLGGLSASVITIFANQICTFIAMIIKADSHKLIYECDYNSRLDGTMCIVSDLDMYGRTSNRRPYLPKIQSAGLTGGQSALEP